MDNKVEQDTIVPKEDILDVETILEPLTSLCRYVALVKFSVNRKTIKYQYKVLGFVGFIIVQMIFWSMIFKDVLIIFRERDSDRILPVFALVTHEVGLAYISITTYLTFSKNYEGFVRSFNQHQRLFVPITYGKRLTIILKRLKWISLFVGLFSVINYISILYLGQNDLRQILYPLNFNGIENTVITLMYFFAHGTFSLAHVGIFVAFAVIVFVMILRLFNSVNKNINSLIEMYMCRTVSDEAFAKKLEKVRQEHTSIVNILETANSLVAHLLFTVVTCFVPILCFVLYGFIRKILTKYEIYLLSSTVLLSVTWNSMFLILASIITLKAHQSLDILLKVDVTSISDKAYESITLFVNRLNGKTIGFRIYEMFTLDASAILMLIGTLVTYAVVMLQFTSTPRQENLILNQTNCTY